MNVERRAFQIFQVVMLKVTRKETDFFGSDPRSHRSNARFVPCIQGMLRVATLLDCPQDGVYNDVVIQDLGGSLLIRYMTLVAKFTEKGACHTGGVGPHRFVSGKV